MSEPIDHLIAIKNIGRHRVILFENAQIHILINPNLRVHLMPSEAIELHRFITRHLSYIAQRQKENQP